MDRHSGAVLKAAHRLDECMTHDNRIEIRNFNCIIQFERDTVPKSGVAIYQNNNIATNFMTPNVEISLGILMLGAHLLAIFMWAYENLEMAYA